MTGLANTELCKEKHSISFFHCLFGTKIRQPVVYSHTNIASNQRPKTYPIGSAGSLKINTIAFMREKRSVPEATVGFVVTNCKSLRRLNTVGRELGCKIILRVQKWSILEVDWYWIAFQDFSCFLGSARTLFLNHYLVDTKKMKNEKEERVEEEKEKAKK